MNARRLCLLFILTAMGSCKLPGAQAHNLRALHEDNGRHKREAKLYQGMEYAWRFGILGKIPGIQSGEEEQEIEPVKDPLGTCLENTNELAEFDPGKGGAEALQVESFTFLATKCRWKLSRARALDELGKTGQRLDLISAAPPPEPAEGGTYAGPQEVADALGALIRALDPKRPPGEPDVT